MLKQYQKLPIRAEIIAINIRYHEKQNCVKNLFLKPFFQNLHFLAAYFIYTLYKHTLT